MPAVRKDSHALGCTTSRLREGILPLIPLLRSPLAVPCGPVSEEAVKMLQGLEHLCCGDRLREWRVSGLWKRWL